MKQSKEMNSRKLCREVRHKIKECTQFLEYHEKKLHELKNFGLVGSMDDINKINI